jgi:uncharacterized protein (UPF0548 family)
VAQTAWPATPSGFRRSERTVGIEADWDAARSVLLAWAVKTRSGFTVAPEDGGALAVRAGANVRVRFAFGPITVTEPARVIAVVDEALRCGFSYGTLEGHPVSGEEAFVLHRASEGASLRLTVRSLTRPAPSGAWRYTFPALLVAQQVFRRRYLRALDEANTASKS